jgi:tRNA(Ile)-lysidine synthase
MIERFHEYIKAKNLIGDQEKILLAVSGGIDSMTMLDLFIQSDYQIAVAHCNFQLRANESEQDQVFVEKFCKKHHIRFFTKRFETHKVSDDLKISIQMAARNLRYDWFNELLQTEGFQKIAVAHNLNDLCETFFINLSRGTGIRGLSGIKAISGSTIRPLLFASRSEIESYVNQKSISYREDSSNRETKYLRNKIRHEIIPVFLSINPSFLESMESTTNIINEAETAYNQHLLKLSESLLHQTDDLIFVNKQKLISLEITSALLYDILLPFNFSYDTINRLLSHVNSKPGLVFYSSTHKIVCDRDDFIIQALRKDEQPDEYVITSNDEIVEYPVKLKFINKQTGKELIIRKKQNVATFDSEKVKFPLTIRKWRKGDYFYPYGMNGRKKLSDFFTDHKFSLIDKEKCWILCCGEDIIWIINHRTDNRYCITRETKNILEIEYSI